MKGVNLWLGTGPAGSILGRLARGPASWAIIGLLLGVVLSGAIASDSPSLRRALTLLASTSLAGGIAGSWKGDPASRFLAKTSGMLDGRACRLIRA
jgi:hypothetical protein